MLDRSSCSRNMLLWLVLISLKYLHKCYECLWAFCSLPLPLHPEVTVNWHVVRQKSSFVSVSLVAVSQCCQTGCFLLGQGSWRVSPSALACHSVAYPGATYFGSGPNYAVYCTSPSGVFPQPTPSWVWVGTWDVVADSTGQSLICISINPALGKQFTLK